MLGRLVQWSSVACGEDVIVVLASRPSDLLAFDDLKSKCDIHRNLDSGAQDFAIGLPCVTIAQVEQRALHENRQVGSDSRGEAFVVHVSAVWPGSGGRYGLSSGRSDAEASQHRLNRHGQV